MAGAKIGLRPAWESFCRADFLEYYHPAIENGFPIRSTIVDPIQAHNGLVQVEPDLLGNAGHLWQCFQQR